MKKLSLIFIVLFTLLFSTGKAQNNTGKVDTQFTQGQKTGEADLYHPGTAEPLRTFIDNKNSNGFPLTDSSIVSDEMKHSPLTPDSYFNMDCEIEWRYATLGKYIGEKKMHTLDIDNDGITEIVAGTAYYWYMLRYDAVKDTVDFLWISDISEEFQSLTCIGVFDINNDNISEIFVGHNNGEIELFDGLMRTLIMELPKIIGLQSIRDIEYADADNDGAKELVVVDFFNTYIVSTDGYTLEQVIPFTDYDCEIGNVDADSFLEIVGSHGKVLQLNGTTLVEEWTYSTANYSSEYRVHLSDIDNDVMKEILRNKDADFEIYDADTKLMKHHIHEASVIMQFIMKDIDNDGIEEIVYGLYDGGLKCYNSSNYQLLWTMQNYNAGVDAINIYDVEGDGALDVIWSAGSGTSNNYYHEFFIADMASQELKCRSLPISQDFNRIASGDIDNDGTTEIIVFESNLLIFDGVTHELESFLSSDYLYSIGVYAVSFKINDIDNDGLEEIVFFGTHGDVGLWYMNGETLTVEKSHMFTNSGIEYFRYIDIDDVDNDGVKEIIGTNLYKYYIINSDNFAIDFSSDFVFQNNETPVRAGNIDNDSQSEIITTQGKLKIFDSQTHVKQEIDWKEFTVCDLYDMNADGRKDIVAGTYDGYVYLIDGKTLLKMSAIKLSPSSITSVTVTDLNSDLKPEIIASSYGTVIIYSDSTYPVYVKKLDPSGFNIGNVVVNDINNDSQYDIIYGGRYQVEQLAGNCYQCMWLNADKTIEKASCGISDGSVVINPKGGKAPYSYAWNNGSTANPLTNLSPGTYIVTITDNNGCVLKDTSIVQRAVLSANFTSVNESCVPGGDGSATVTITEGTEPITYLWNTGSIAAGISNKAKGTYSVTVNDSKNCVLNETLLIQKDTLILQVTKNDISCFGYNNGLILIHPETGNPPYAYSWSSGQNSAQIYNLGAGIYAFDVMDSKGCFAHDSRTITEPEMLTSSIQSTADTNTNQFGDGTATVIVAGGTPPYSYRWNDPFAQTTATAYNLFNGKYTVITKDARSCLLIDTVYVAETNAVFEIFDSGKLSVFPNPARGIIYLDVDFDEIQNLQVDVYDLSGRKVFSNLYQDITQALLPIDLSAFAPGSYNVIIRSDSGYAHRKVQLVK
jgi:hypothetical protein